MKIEFKERNLPISDLNTALFARMLDHFQSNLECDLEAEGIPTLAQDTVEQ